MLNDKWFLSLPMHFAWWEIKNIRHTLSPRMVSATWETSTYVDWIMTGCTDGWTHGWTNRIQSHHHCWRVSINRTLNWSSTERSRYHFWGRSSIIVKFSRASILPTFGCIPYGLSSDGSLSMVAQKCRPPERSGRRRLEAERLHLAKEWVGEACSEMFATHLYPRYQDPFTSMTTSPMDFLNHRGLCLPCHSIPGVV